MGSSETTDLVTAYYGIENPRKRRAVHDLIATLSKADWDEPRAGTSRPVHRYTIEKHPNPHRDKRPGPTAAVIYSRVSNSLTISLVRSTRDE